MPPPAAGRRRVPDRSTSGASRGPKKGGTIYPPPLPGGSEEQVADSVYERSFTVAENGVYYIPAPTSGPMVVKFLDFATRKIRDAGRLEGPTFEGLSVSPDGKYLLYTQTDGAGADL